MKQLESELRDSVQRLDNHENRIYLLVSRKINPRSDLLLELEASSTIYVYSPNVPSSGELWFCSDAVLISRSTILQS